MNIVTTKYKYLLRLFLFRTCSHPHCSEHYDGGAGGPGGHREHGGSLSS